MVKALSLFVVIAAMFLYVPIEPEGIREYPGERAAVERSKEPIPCRDYTLGGISDLDVVVAKGRNPIVLVTDAASWKPDSDLSHLEGMHALAKGSFALSCAEWDNATHPVFWAYAPSDPLLVSLIAGQHARATGQVIAREIARIAKKYDVKIITHSSSPGLYWVPLLLDELELLDISPLVIQATGNFGGNVPAVRWALNSEGSAYGSTESVWYDRALNVVRSRHDGRVIEDHHLADRLQRLVTAAEQGKVLFTTGNRPNGAWDIRATACGVVSISCVSTHYEMHISLAKGNIIATGTSIGPPRLGMALASVALAFPELEPSELAFLAQVCAVGKHQFVVAPPLLLVSLGHGRADFQCLYRSDGSLKSLAEVRAMIEEG